MKHAHARTEHLLSVWRPVGLCWIYRLPATFNLLYALAMANVANIYCHSKYFKSLKRHKSRYSNSSGNTFKWFKCSRLCQVFRPCPFSSSLSLFPIHPATVCAPLILMTDRLKCSVFSHRLFLSYLVSTTCSVLFSESRDHTGQQDSQDHVRIWPQIHF